MGLTMSNEIEIYYSRFPESKQEQVRTLVSYASLLGLSGKDLISIGSKLDRIKESESLTYRKSIISQYKIKPVDNDWPVIAGDFWKLLAHINKKVEFEINGVWYMTDLNPQSHCDWVSGRIANKQTKKIQAISFPIENKWGRNISTRKIALCEFLWKLHQGEIVLP